MRPSACVGLGAVLLSALLFPLLTPLAPPGSLDDIRSWALQGPGRDIPVPLMGVYVFRGLNPFLLADLSHARGWDARSRSFVYDMAGPGTVVVPGATTGDFSGEHATTSPALHSALTGAAFLRLFRVLRYTNTFEFNADFTAATIRPQFFGGWLPLGSALARLLREEMVLDRRSGVWKRINFAPPRNATPTAAHYFLNPVLSLPPAQHGARRARLHADGLALAKRKLAMARDPALARVAS